MKIKNTSQGCIVNSLLILAVLAGCSSRTDVNEAIARVNSNNIQRLANLYFTYQMKNDWRGPTDEEEFKEFIRSYNPRKLTRIGIDPNAVDELFINERDGQPFKIRYSVRGSAMGSSEPVIFETVGVSESRMVGFLNMVQREVEEAEYNDLWEGKIQPEQTSGNAARESL